MERQLKQKQHTGQLHVITVFIKKEVILALIALHQSLPGQGDLHTGRGLVCTDTFFYDVSIQ